MNTCICVIKSGPRKGQVCGRRAADQFCGVHKTCTQAAPSSDQGVLNLIRRVILEYDPALITDAYMSRVIETNFPNVNAVRYKLLWMSMLNEKISRAQSAPCKRCGGALQRLYI